jgi:hypothetical protein
MLKSYVKKFLQGLCSVVMFLCVPWLCLDLLALAMPFIIMNDAVANASRIPQLEKQLTDTILKLETHLLEHQMQTSQLFHRTLDTKPPNKPF